MLAACGHIATPQTRAPTTVRAQALDWQTSTVFDTPDVDDGGYPSIALDADGHPHIAYVDDTADNVMIASYDPDSTPSWTTHVVASATPDTGRLSLALDGDSHPHIASSDLTFASVDDPCRLLYTSYDPTTEAWSTTIADDGTDSDFGVVGGFITLALDKSDDPHISYAGAEWSGMASILKYAWHDSAGWHHTTVDDGSGTSYDLVGYFASLALDQNDDPHISYAVVGTSVVSSALQHAWYQNGSWRQPEYVDTTGIVGVYNAFAIDPSTGTAYISYYDATNENLKLAIGTFTENLTPEDAITDLKTTVENLDYLKPGQITGLTRPLDNALRSLGKDRTDDACNQLADFVAKVDAKTPAPLLPGDAASLISDANAIRDDLGCTY